VAGCGEGPGVEARELAEEREGACEGVAEEEIWIVKVFEGGIGRSMEENPGGEGKC